MKTVEQTETFSPINYLELMIEIVREEYLSYVTDLSSLFHEHECTVYYSEAEEILSDYGTFEAIAELVEYEKFNYGDVYVDLTNPCDIVNRLFVVKASEYLYQLQDDNEEIGKIFMDNWDNVLSDNDRKRLVECLEQELEDYL